MKTVLPLATPLMLTALALRGAEAPTPVPVESSVAAVTVYADRARVTRRAPLELRQGVQVLEFRRLPGWIDEASVRLALLPAEAGRIVDVQVSREFLAQAGDQELQKAEAVARAMADEMAAIDDDLKALAQQAKQIEDVRVFSMEKLPRDMAARDIGIETYAKAVDFVADALRRNAAARRELEHKRRDIEPRRAAHAKKLEQLQGLVQLQQTLVRATVDGAAAGKADVALTYMLPGATWEPVHELRAVGQTPDAGAFTSYAVISQTTGEDWIGADLAFATQSSEATIRIPELSALLLNDRTVPRLSAAGPDTFARAQALYKEQNGRWYAYNRGAAADADFFDNATRQEEAQNKAAAVFEKLQRRGTTAHFPARGQPVTIRGDGRAVRVPIGAGSLPAVHRIVAAPEAALNAARVLQLTNTCGQALLPGRIALYHDGAFLGMTDMDFAAPAESFPVFLGVADQIKLTRVLDRQRSSIVRGRRTRMQVRFDGSVENLSGAPAQVMLTDRVPVSENKEIRVSGISTEPDAEPDSKGIVKWAVSLKPGQTFRYRVEYTVEYPPEEVERMARESKASPQPAAAADLSVQIQSLESKF